MAKLERFILNEAALAPLTPAVRKRVLKTCERVSWCRGEHERYRALEASATSDDDKILYWKRANFYQAEIGRLLKEVGHFEFNFYDGEKLSYIPNH